MYQLIVAFSTTVLTVPPAYPGLQTPIPTASHTIPSASRESYADYIQFESLDYLKTQTRTQSDVIREFTRLHYAERIDGLNTYLRTMVKEKYISEDTESQCLKVWEDLSQAVMKDGKLLPIPDACPGPNGEILYTWDNGNDHFEVEVVPDEPASYYYVNRETKETWYDEFEVGTPISAKAFDILRKIFAS